MLAAALKKAFHSAMAGRCQERAGLSETAIPLSVFLPVVSCRRGEFFLRGLFEPLGYRVDARSLALDSTEPSWGDSRFFSLTLSHCLPLKDLLAHLYLLLPVLDGRKHYRVAVPDVEKILRYGEGWLFRHPAREVILWRFLQGRDRLLQAVQDRLPPQLPERELGASEQMPFPELVGLNEQRIRTVLEVLLQSVSGSVVDLGCGEGRLLQHLLKHNQFHQILGIDVSGAALAKAAQRLALDSDRSGRVEIRQGSLFYRDSRYRAFDAAVAVEVIEHLEPNRLACFEEALFGFARPGLVLITTPNFEYNARLFWILPGHFRHSDHRFEWTRQQFAQWAAALAARRGYDVRCLPVGPEHSEFGAPSQMAVFTRQDSLPGAVKIHTLPSLDALVGGCRVESAMGRVRLDERGASRALELMSRFGVDPRWLIYLPGLVPPPAASVHPDFLEHPKEAFDYFRKAGCHRVVCREKPMGTRVVLVLCRSQAAAERRFGISGRGACYTASGRPFLQEDAELFDQLHGVFESVAFWEEYRTDWVCLECVMLPWVGRAEGLFKYRYASLATAAEADLAAAREAVAFRGAALETQQDALAEGLARVAKFQDIYRKGAAQRIDTPDCRLMPVALLAVEGANYTGKDPLWQASRLEAICRYTARLQAPKWRRVDLEDESSMKEAVGWWEALTDSGAAGMVVLPECSQSSLGQHVSGSRQIQPALQVRGREFLRLIYGPEYTLPHLLQRLKQRRTLLKRNIALRQHVLNQEALNRFLSGEALDRVHECVFAALGLK